MNEIFEFAPHCKIDIRNNFFKLKNYFRKTNMGQKTISYFGPSIWNSLPDPIKKVNSLNTFKHNVKKHYLTWKTHNVYMWICVSVFIYVCMSVGAYTYTYGYILVSFPLTYHSHAFFFSFTLFSYYHSDLRDHNENKAFLHVLCYPSHCWCFSYLSAAIYFNFNFYIFTFYSFFFFYY